MYETKTMMPRSQTRCPWGDSDPVYYVPYHDEEWGVPTHEDQKLFEMLTLEGAQAGLSWITILKKREHYRRAFSGFDPRVIARYDSRKRPEPSQDRIDDQERPGVSRRTDRVRIVRPLHLAVCGW